MADLILNKRRESLVGSLLPLLFKAQMEKQQREQTISQFPQMLQKIMGSQGGMMEQPTGGGAVPSFIMKPSMSISATGEPSASFGYVENPEYKYQKEVEQVKKKADVKSQAEKKQADAFIKELAGSWKLTNPQSVKETTGGIGGKGYSRILTQATGFQGTPEARAVKEYSDFVKGIRSRLARTIGKDVGNLSEYEQKVIEQIVPIVIGPKTDLLETGLGKMRRIQRVLNDIYESRAAGFNDLEDYYKSGNAQSWR